MRCWAGVSIVEKDTQTPRICPLRKVRMMRGEGSTGLGMGLFDITSREEEPAAAFLTAGKSVMFTTDWVGCEDGMGAHAALRNAESPTILAVGEKRKNAFMCRGDRCREIPCCAIIWLYRGVVGMMLLHDLLHILACTCPPSPPPPKKIVDAQEQMQWCYDMSQQYYSTSAVCK